ncbi:3-hydroxybutyryl-CoA dehydrogenase [Desulfosporosinus sp. I2]|uniref:3-hydroxyacyl-CoA dehydrogenase family protein n=1 Tax=Desulfosporosinus sp. I2 TaxID=1617025 RepID=UPI00061EA1B9|nr:3-hydroxyacyl-CoA dehydrogenase NAD-binding domain-containing protein [Desulfosporosinus sp. I2]KJR48301.1 3-hydroxybutyryl-CoA dehydrogenase [Desulfosporosinus sp. I2]
MSIGIVGSGTMGAGIAQVAAQAGYEVFLWDLNEELVQSGLANIQKSLNMIAQKGETTVETAKQCLERINTTTNLANLSSSDFIIESVIEKLEIKKSLFKKLDGLCPPETILATNTSGLSITELAAATNRQEKVIGTHFFIPPPRMEPVELVQGYHTSEATLKETEKLLISFGKTVIKVKDSPLFVFNRIINPMINEAIFVLQEGLATAEDIDKVMKLAGHHPIGPLALADFCGLDVVLMVSETLFRDTGDTKYRTPVLLRQLVSAGHLGRKTGKGFFEY